MFARPKINQLLANFKKKPVQPKLILFESGLLDTNVSISCRTVR